MNSTYLVLTPAACWSFWASCWYFLGAAAVPNLGVMSWAVPVVFEQVEAAPGHVGEALEQAEVVASLQQTLLTGLVPSFL